MRQWISAPGTDSQIVKGSVLGVFLDDSERVEWTYAILPDGKWIVTGYNILPILSPASDDSAAR